MILVPAFLFAAGNEAVRIPLAMLLVFGSAKLLAELCERFGQPGIVGEILAGVLIGPSVLGWVAPNDFLQTMASMGAMFLLFRVGLEVKASELMRVGGTATLVAICAPAILIALVTLYTNATDTSTTIFGHASFSVFGWTFGWYGIGGVIAMFAGPVAYLYFKRTLGGRPLQPEPVREPTDAV